VNKRLLLLPCLLALSALALAACGGGGDDSGDEGQIEEAIETSATTSDPSNCTVLSTQAFVEQSSDETGKAAVKACEEEAKDPTNNADSVKVTNIEIDGSKATADAAIVGGGFDGQTVTIALVAEEDRWKLDQITGFAKLDTVALAKVFETELEASEELTAEQTSCIVEGLEAASKAEAEELLLSGSSTPFVELAEGCA
jgi:hypothetical protein